MTIPDYQSLMLPLLKLSADQQEHMISEAFDELAELFKLTEQEDVLAAAQRYSRFLGLQLILG